MSFIVSGAALGYAAGGSLLAAGAGAIGGMALGSAMGGSSDGPDYSGMNQAAIQEAQLSKEQLDWIKQVYKDEAPNRAFASDTARKVTGLQLEAMRKGIDQADDYADYSRTTFRPLEQSIVRDATNFNSEQERERLAGLAGGDVAQSFGAARSQLRRDIGRAGLNPADGAFAGGLRDLAAGEALATAGAKNKARSDAISLGRALRMDAASLGRNLPGSQATQQQIALSAGNSGVTNANVPNQVTAGGVSLMSSGYDAASRGNMNSANIYGRIAGLQQQADAADSAAMAGLGQTAGSLAAMYFSDKDQKTDRKPASGQIALAAARKMPVEKWRYRSDSPAADGGQEHVGPMAQDVQAALGDTAAPGGKMVDPISLAGTTLAAVQQVDKNQQQLEKRVISLESAVRGAKPAPKKKRAADSKPISLASALPRRATV